jgi:beta-lactamase class A
MNALLALGAITIALPGKPGTMVQLNRELASLCTTFHGRVGYAVKNLKTGQTIALRENEEFPSASTIKTAILIEVANQIEEGKLAWTTAIPLPPEKARSSSMWTAFLRDGLSVNVDGLANLMMNVSDNTAAIFLSDKVGVENIERRMIGFGLLNTACTIHVPPNNPRLTDLRTRFQNMGVTSPRDMALLLQRIYEKKATHSVAAGERLLRIMSHEYWDDYFTGQIPPGTYVCSKVGALNRSRSDVAIVFGNNPYILTVYTAEDTDTSWGPHNEAEDLLRHISALVWKRMEPHSPYSEPPDAPHWYPTGAGVE